MKRREFLYLVGSLAAAPYANVMAAPPSKSKYLILNSFASQKVKDDAKTHTAINMVGGMLTYDPETKKSDVIYIPNYVHSWAQNPVVPMQVVGVARWTQNAMVMNMNRRRVTHKLLSPKGSVFCGYGTYSQTGSVIFLPAFDTLSGKTFICVFSAIKWNLAGVLATDDLFPSGCVTLSNGDLVILHESSSKNKSQSSLTIIDTKTLKSKLRYDVPATIEITLLDKDQILLGGHDGRLNLMVFDTRKNQFVSRVSPELLKQHKVAGQPRSFQMLTKSAVAVIMRDEGNSAVVLWDYESQHMQKIEFLKKRLRGMTVLNDVLYVNDQDGKGHQYQIVGSQKPVLKVLPDRIANLGNGGHMKTILSP